MILDQININALRVFETVFKLKSMTAAAAELHLTQPGVSQHIKNLESVLGIKLFDRINRQLIPTEKAIQLYNVSTEKFRELEKCLGDINSNGLELQGRIKVAIPMEFGLNVILPIISNFTKSYPQIKFEISFGLGPDVNNKLVTGELDMAFVDEFFSGRTFFKELIFKEKLKLCQSSELPEVKASNFKDLQKQNFLAYDKNESVLRKWFQFYHPNKPMKLNVVCQVPDAFAISKLICSGLGLGVIPMHLLNTLKKENRPIKELKVSGEDLTNSIFLTYLEGREVSLPSKKFMEYLKNSLI